MSHPAAAGFVGLSEGHARSDRLVDDTPDDVQSAFLQLRENVRRVGGEVHDLVGSPRPHGFRGIG